MEKTTFIILTFKVRSIGNVFIHANRFFSSQFTQSTLKNHWKLKMYHFQPTISQKLRALGEFFFSLPGLQHSQNTNRQKQSEVKAKKRHRCLLKFSPYFELSLQFVYKSFKCPIEWFFILLKGFWLTFMLVLTLSDWQLWWTFWIFSPSYKRKCTRVECPELG